MFMSLYICTKERNDFRSLAVGILSMEQRTQLVFDCQFAWLAGHHECSMSSPPFCCDSN